MIEMPNLDFFRIYPSLFDFLSDVESELIILCPFVKKSALEKVLGRLPKKTKIVVVVRWKLEDIIFGSSDLEIYPYLKELGHKLYINRDIHLKVFVKDKKKIFLGSANITNSGLGLIENSNIEAVSRNDLDDKSLFDVFKVLRSSILVDDELFIIISNMVSKLEGPKQLIESESKRMKDYNKKIFKKKEINVVVADFPFSGSPEIFIDNYLGFKLESSEMKHDMSLYGISEGKSKEILEKKLKAGFLSSNAFFWQCSIIKEEVSFGEYSSLLHDALMDDPKPYRKRVKELVNSMLCWTNYYSDDFKIRKYRHTYSLYRR